MGVTIKKKSDKALITVKDLTWGYDGFPLFKKFNFSLYENDFAVIMGDSGVGKSTLVKLITRHISIPAKSIYHKLEDLEEPIEFDFTDEQWDRFDKEFELIYNDTIESSQSFSSNVKRYGLICFRIAMILTTIREMETITDKKILECSNMDFIIALKLTKILLGHSRFIFDSFDENNWLSTQDEKILDDLSNEFERKQAVEMCEKHNIGIRTIDSRLSKWQKMRIIRRVKKGVYKKL